MGTCQYCGGNGSWYGMAPHRHILSQQGNARIGVTTMLPTEKWPKNFSPDEETDGGCGVWTCEHCNGTGQNRLEPYGDNECPHEHRFNYKGYLTCRNCGFVYSDRTCSWVGAPKDEY